MSSKNKKLTIQKTKLILAEGADAYFFLIWALEAYSIEDVQVMDFGGIEELDKFMKALTQLDGFDDVETLIVARDAETNFQKALSDVKISFENSDYAHQIMHLNLTKQSLELQL